MQEYLNKMKNLKELIMIGGLALGAGLSMGATFSEKPNVDLFFKGLSIYSASGLALVAYTKKNQTPKDLLEYEMRIGEN
jgi:hypothetical protein